MDQLNRDWVKSQLLPVLNNSPLHVFSHLSLNHPSNSATAIWPHPHPLEDLDQPNRQLIILTLLPHPEHPLVKPPTVLHPTKDTLIAAHATPRTNNHAESNLKREISWSVETLTSRRVSPRAQSPSHRRPQEERATKFQHALPQTSEVQDHPPMEDVSLLALLDQLSLHKIDTCEN